MGDYCQDCLAFGPFCKGPSERASGCRQLDEWVDALNGLTLDLPLAPQPQFELPPFFPQLLNGLEVPRWVRDALHALPAEMAESGRVARAYENGVLDLAEALVLRAEVGRVLVGVVTDVHPKTGMGTVQVADPAVELRVKASQKEVGSEIRVRVDKVDVRSGKVALSRPN